MRGLAEERRRFRVRRSRIPMERESVSVNKSQQFRLYREESLAVRQRRGRKRGDRTANADGRAEWPNQRSSLAFVADAMWWGRPFRFL